MNGVDLLVSAMRAAAEEEILPRFRNLGAAEIGQKTHFADLVTVADTAAEAHVMARLAQDWPGLPVLGEEGVADNPALRARMGTEDLAVVLDPIDGTWNYARGLALFGMIGAVVQRGQPVAGVLYDPIGDDWILATEGGPTLLCDAKGGARRLATSTLTDPAELTGYFAAGLFEPDLRRAGVLAGLGYGRILTLRCACHEYRLIAQGFSEFALSGPVPHPWDHAAGVLAVRQAGGVARFLDGQDYTLTREAGVLLVASSEAVWDRVANDFAALAVI
jgi:fructose-1,6-bisphosphatase/inositol monophosphatase family enzyme